MKRIRFTRLKIYEEIENDNVKNLKLFKAQLSKK